LNKFSLGQNVPGEILLWRSLKVSTAGVDLDSLIDAKQVISQESRSWNLFSGE
jgi:hypothetical protein